MSSINLYLCVLFAEALCGRCIYISDLKIEAMPMMRLYLTLQNRYSHQCYGLCHILQGKIGAIPPCIHGPIAGGHSQGEIHTQMKYSRDISCSIIGKKTH